MSTWRRWSSSRGPLLAREAAQRDRAARDLRGAVPGARPGRSRARLPDAARVRAGPPRGLWGRSAQARSTTAESWLGRPFVADPSIDSVVLRYLAAFGPASVADVTTWCRLTGMRAVVERLRPQLVTLPGRARPRALRPALTRPATLGGDAAPVRFLPEYDNVLLSHDDRSRFFVPADRAALGPRAGRSAAARSRTTESSAASGGWSRTRPGRAPRRRLPKRGARCDRRGGPAARAVPRGRAADVRLLALSP